MASSGTSSNDSISLNLNPMLDIFSILITFLLMSFSTDPVSHDLPPGLELPESQTLTSLDEIPTIVVTKNEIFVNDKKVVSLFGGDVQAQDNTQGAIYPLFQELEKLAEANKRVMKTVSANAANKPGQLTLEMDKDHNFKLIKRIMLSAQQAEFVTIKMAVTKENT